MVGEENAEELERISDECAWSLTEEAAQCLNSIGINDGTIKKFKIGFGKFYDEEWITLPVYDRDGLLRYIKLLSYQDILSRHTNSNIKTLTYPKECNPIIFNESTLFGRIDCVVVGSEFDAVVASQYL